MPGAWAVGQFDDGPRAWRHAEKPFQIRSVDATSKSVVDTRMTADQSYLSPIPLKKTKSDRDGEYPRIVSVFVKYRCASGCAVRFGAVWADVRSFGPCVIRSLAQHYER